MRYQRWNNARLGLAVATFFGLMVIVRAAGIDTASQSFTPTLNATSPASSDAALVDAILAGVGLSGSASDELPTSTSSTGRLAHSISDQTSAVFENISSHHAVAPATISSSASRALMNSQKSSKLITTLKSSRGNSSATPTYNASITDCQAALVSWSSMSSHIHKDALKEITTTNTWLSKHEIEWGFARVYTVLHGYTHAHGSLNVTSISTYTATHSVVNTRTVVVTTKATKRPVPPRPDCTIEPSSCAALYLTYRSSLGLDSTDLLPQPFFDPTNSPRCTLTQGTSSCVTRDVGGIRTACELVAHTVRLYYWRTGTASTISAISDVNKTDAVPAPTDPPKTIVTYGKTMTSPSIYLHFDTLNAVSPGAYWVDCPSSFSPTPSLFWKTLGHQHTSQWFSFLPESVSTLEKYIDTDAVKLVPTDAMSSLRRYAHSYRPQAITSKDPFGAWPNLSFAPFPHAALTAMGNANASDYSLWASVIASASLLVTSSRIDFHELIRPGPRAYYLRPAAKFSASKLGYIDAPYARGCHPQGPHPACDTIIHGEYHAQLSIPDVVRNLDPAWATCQPALLGVYDPPIGLDATDSADMPDVTITTPFTTTAAHPVFSFAPIVSPTVLPDIVTVSSAEDEVTSNDPASASATSRSDSGQQTYISVFKQITTTFVVSSQGADPVLSKPNVEQSGSDPSGTNSDASSAADMRFIAFSDPVGVATGQTVPSNAIQALTQSGSTHLGDTDIPSGAGPTAVMTMGSVTMTATKLPGHVMMGGIMLKPGSLITISGFAVSNAVSAMGFKPLTVPSTLPTGENTEPPRPSGLTATSSTLPKLSASSIVLPTIATVSSLSVPSSESALASTVGPASDSTSTSALFDPTEASSGSIELSTTSSPPSVVQRSSDSIWSKGQTPSSMQAGVTSKTSQSSSPKVQAYAGSATFLRNAWTSSILPIMLLCLMSITYNW